MSDFTIQIGTFQATQATIVPNTDEAKRFLALGPAGASMNVRRSAVEHYLTSFADEGFSCVIEFTASMPV